MMASVKIQVDFEEENFDPLEISGILPFNIIIINYLLST